MRSHSVTCHPAEVTFLPLPQPKLVLDLATPEGCKAELTWVVVISLDSLPAKYGHLSGPIASISDLGNWESSLVTHSYVCSDTDILTLTQFCARLKTVLFCRAYETLA